MKIFIGLLVVFLASFNAEARIDLEKYAGLVWNGPENCVAVLVGPSAEKIKMDAQSIFRKLEVKILASSTTKGGFIVLVSDSKIDNPTSLFSKVSFPKAEAKDEPQIQFFYDEHRIGVVVKVKDNNLDKAVSVAQECIENYLDSRYVRLVCGKIVYDGVKVKEVRLVFEKQKNNR